MYTSCPECGTVYRISIHDLRAAEGYARCGHCSATFNALTTLVDEPPPTVTLNQLVLPTEPHPPAPIPEPTPEPSPEPSPEPADDEVLEFNIPEDSWTHFFEKGLPTAPPFAAGAPAGNEAAAEPEVVPEPELEPASELEPKPEQEPELELEPEGDAVAEPEHEHDIGTGIGSETVDQVGLYRALSAEAAAEAAPEAAAEEPPTEEPKEPEELELPHKDDDWQTLLDEMPEDDAVVEPVYVISEERLPEAPVGPPAEPALPSDDPLDAPLAMEGAWDESVLDRTSTPAPLPADFAAHLHTTDEPPATADEEPPITVADRPFVWTPPVPPPEKHPAGRWIYTVGSAVLLLLLATQVIHQQRDRLATYPALTEAMTRLYAALDLPLWPAWDLRAYEVRQYEAIADRSSIGALDVLARIAVVGNEPVGLPLVRITLTDRFGKPLGVRVFNPGEYLGNNPRPREPLVPGTMIPVDIHLKDPGADAQGINIDLCLMNRRSGLTCRAELEPFAR